MDVSELTWSGSTRFAIPIASSSLQNPAAIFSESTSGRNVVIGPGTTELGASMSSAFRIMQHMRLDFRAEFFNLPNHPILGQPVGTVGTSTYGVISSTKLDARQIQFALKPAF